MTVNVLIFYQNSGVTPSKAYYSNTRNHFCMNSALLLLRGITFEKNSKCDTKASDLSVRYDG